MYGPADPQWGSWLLVPEAVMNAYVAMLPRLEAEQTQRMVNALLAAGGHSMRKDLRAAYLRGLEDQANGGRVLERPMRPRPGQLQRLGLRTVIEEKRAAADWPGTNTAKGGENR